MVGIPTLDPRKTASFAGVSHYASLRRRPIHKLRPPVFNEEVFPSWEQIAHAPERPRASPGFPAGTALAEHRQIACSVLLGELSMTQLTSSGLLPVDKINVFWRSDGEFAPSRVSELSRKGAFIQTPEPAPVGASLDVRLDAPGREICAQAVVRRVAPGKGMAVEFDLITEDDQERLEALVKEIEVAHVLQVARSASPPPGIPLGHSSTKSPKPSEAPALPRNRRIDRRSRIRHKSTATVELTEFGSAESVQA